MPGFAGNAPCCLYSFYNMCVPKWYVLLSDLVLLPFYSRLFPLNTSFLRFPTLVDVPAHPFPLLCPGLATALDQPLPTPTEQYLRKVQGFTVANAATMNILKTFHLYSPRTNLTTTL